MLRKALLVCGILSRLLYVAMNVFVAMQWQGYSSASQTVSELSAIGAPTRSLWVLPAAFYTVLVKGLWMGRLEIGRSNSHSTHCGGPDRRLRCPRPRLAVCPDAPS
jgi:hypothetical protein